MILDGNNFKQICYVILSKIDVFKNCKNPKGIVQMIIFCNYFNIITEIIYLENIDISVLPIRLNYI